MAQFCLELQTGSKMGFCPSQTGLLYNFCFINVLPRCTLDAAEPLQTLVWDPSPQVYGQG